METIETLSLCPVCLERIEARYITEGNTTYLEKSCAKHGFFKTKVWQGPPALADWLRKPDNVPPALHQRQAYLGCPYDCGICPAHQQAACCIVFDVTNRCDLNCPVCLADAGEAPPGPSLERIAELYEALLAGSPGRPYNIQLSGGEPLTRPDLPQIIALGKAKGFPYIQVNTNGLRLAQEPNLARQLQEAGLDSVFLQFDGLDDAVYMALRGRPLLEQKQQAIAHCRAAGLGVVLVMVVMPQYNLRQIGPVLDYALSQMPTVRGIHFQPVSYMGRFPQAPADADRLTLPELVGQLELQSKFRLSRQDFIPLVSGHSMCSFHGNFIVEEDGRILAISAEEDSACCTCKQDSIARARAYIAKKWRTAAPQQAAEEWELFVRQADARGFSITAMAFQDVWNIDLNRLRKCRVQTAVADGRLLPLCAYHITAQNGDRLYGRV